MMTETGTSDRPSVAKPASRPRSRKPATVSVSALALHLDCSRTYISKLEVDGVIQRQGDGFSLDQNRVAYLRYLRRERRQSPRMEADADHVKVKTEMLQKLLMEKRRELLRRADVDGLIDQIAGTVLTHLSGMAARCSRDMAQHRCRGASGPHRDRRSVQQDRRRTRRAAAGVSLSPPTVAP
jgi:hypothetical protein